MMFKLVFIFTTFVCLCQSENQNSSEFSRRSFPILQRFTSIKIDGIFDVTLESVELTTQSSFEIETTNEGHEKVLIQTSINEPILRIYVNGSLSLPKIVVLHIRYNEPLIGLYVGGVSTVVATKPPIYSSEEFLLDVRGTSRVGFQISTQRLFVSASDVGQVRIEGRASQYAIYRATGGSAIDGWNFITPQVTAEASGISTIHFIANDDAAIRVDGISTVTYRLLNGRQASRATSIGLGNIVLV